MRRIAHISDLHFGTEAPSVARGLLVELATRTPNFVAVSGDLTQRARSSEFAAARAFLDEIACPVLVVPGNHDIPLYNLAARFIRPLSGYRKFVTPDLQPFYRDAEMSVVGANTARSNTWKEGRISLEQLKRMREQFDSAGATPLKILVAHHPFLSQENDRNASLVGRLPQALQMLDECSCDLILAGHLHQAYSGNQRSYQVQKSRSILIAQAGTAISQRRRNEPNTYNEIEFHDEQLRLEVRGWQGSRFETVAVKHFFRGEDGWLGRTI